MNHLYTNFKNSLLFRRLSILFLSLLLVSGVWGQINISVGGSAVTQNFNGVTGTTLPTNWRVTKSGSFRTIQNYPAGASVENSAINSISTTASHGSYKVGINTPTVNYAIGGLTTSNAATRTVNIFTYLNNSAATAIAKLKLSYDVSKYRTGSNPEGFYFKLFYSFDGTSWTDAGSSFTTNFDADLSTDNNTTGNPISTVSISETELELSSPVAQNGKIYLQWSYSLRSGSTSTNSQLLAIDNISIEAMAGCTNPSAPTGSITALANPACGNTTLHYNGSETNTFWQTSTTGTSTDYNVTSDYTLNSSGTMYVRTRNGSTTCWSDAIASNPVTIYTVPVITSNPVNRNILGTTNTTFSVANSGSAQSYTWQVDNGGGWTTVANGGVYSTANTATLTLTNVPLSYNGYKYRAIANGNAPCGSSAPSAEATLTVTDPSIQTVTTNAASGVVNTTATLNGNATQVAVSPATTERGFVYSITSSNADPIFGGSGVSQIEATGTSATPFSVNVGSLQPNTQYSVKAYLYNGSYVYGATQTFTTLAVASHIEFNPAPPSSGDVGQNLTSFSVRALRPDNSVDAEYTGAVTLTKASGAGNISGTLVINAIAGIATFSNIQFDAPGAYTIRANSGSFSNITSSNITLSLQNTNLIEFAGNSGCSSGTSGTWQTNTNWCGNNIPRINDVALFTGKGTNTTIGFNMNNPTSGTTTIAGIYINNSATTDKRIWNSSTTVAGSITIKGAIIDGNTNVVINNSGGATFEISDGCARTLGLNFDNTNNNNIVINGTGSLLISTFITGAVPVTKLGTGSGILEFSGANTYTGLTTVTEGTLRLNRTGGTTLPSTNSVLVNGGKLLVSTNQTLSNLTLTSGELEIPAGVTLTVNGDFKYVAGTITGTGNLVYGNIAKLVYENTTSHNIGNEWNASTKEVDLNTPSDLVATDNLTVDKFKLTSGKLTLGANNLTVGQIEGGSKTSFIVTNGTGALTVKNVAATAVTFPVGISAGSYSPARISNTNTNDFTVKVRAMTDIYGSNPSWSYSNVLNKAWDITPAGTGANANITLFWDTDNAATEEGEEFHENNDALRKVMIHFTGTIWEEYLSSTYASTGGFNSVNYSGITAFSPFGAALEGMNNTVLPVNIKSFAGNKLSLNNVLNWELATETNISQYIIERSINGTQYLPIGSVNYNTANGGKYSFEDAGVNTIAYYRLKIVNNDGSFSYSKIIMLNRADVSKLTITPNPVINNVFVTFGKVNTNAQLFVTTINGSVVKQIALAENSIQATVDASALSAGTYIVTIKDGNSIQTKKFIKL